MPFTVHHLIFVQTSLYSLGPEKGPAAADGIAAVDEYLNRIVDEFPGEIEFFQQTTAALYWEYEAKSLLTQTEKVIQFAFDVMTQWQLTHPNTQIAIAMEFLGAHRWLKRLPHTRPLIVHYGSKVNLCRAMIDAKDLHDPRTVVLGPTAAEFLMNLETAGPKPIGIRSLERRLCGENVFSMSAL